MSLSIETKNENGVTVDLIGRLDTVTAPSLEVKLDEILPTTETLVIDMEKLEYVSSAGLRLLLKAQKEMSKKGGMKLTHVNDEVMEVFEITGFSDILTVE